MDHQRDALRHQVASGLYEYDHVKALSKVDAEMNSELRFVDPASSGMMQRTPNSSRPVGSLGSSLTSSGNCRSSWLCLNWREDDWKSNVRTEREPTTVSIGDLVSFFRYCVAIYGMKWPPFISALNVDTYDHVAVVKVPVMMRAIKYVSAYEPTSDSTASQRGIQSFDLTLVKQPGMESNEEDEKGKGSEQVKNRFSHSQNSDLMISMTALWQWQGVF